MSKLITKKPLAVALGAVFVTSLAGVSTANAADNPFGMSELSSGYQVLAEGKCGEGKCGGNKAKKEAKCGEGKCGGNKAKHEGKCGEGKCGMKMMDADGNGSVTKAEFMAAHDKKFAAMDKNSDGTIDAGEMAAKMKEGKCGEGKCGGDKAKKEAKCGEGKCGGMK